MNTIHHTLPWDHWVADNFLSIECLKELLAIEHENPQEVYGKRESSTRFFITPHNKTKYPQLSLLYDSLVNGDYRHYFETTTGSSFTDLYLRVEVISDVGDFYLEPHADVPEKKLTALVYTDSTQGTSLYKGTEFSHNVETKENRCMFFVPSEHTFHGYERTIFTKPRRCLLINYWTYGDETQKI